MGSLNSYVIFPRTHFEYSSIALFWLLVHSHKIPMVQQDEPCYLAILSNLCSPREVSRKCTALPWYCLQRISNGTNSLKLALLYYRNYLRVYNIFHCCTFKSIVRKTACKSWLVLYIADRIRKGNLPAGKLVNQKHVAKTEIPSRNASNAKTDVGLPLVANIAKSLLITWDFFSWSPALFWFLAVLLGRYKVSFSFYRHIKKIFGLINGISSCFWDMGLKRQSTKKPDRVWKQPVSLFPNFHEIWWFTLLIKG